MAETYRRGEPYRLQGKKLAFCNWHMVSTEPGLSWYDEHRQEDHSRALIMNRSAPDDPEVQWKPPFPNIGIRLKALPAIRSGPILRPEKPWESRGLSGTMIQDGSIYKAWCTTGWHYDRSHPDNYVCYLESRDGYEWERPDCGILEYGGNRNNNLINREYGWMLHTGGIFLDPSAAPEQRYKWVSEANFTREETERFMKLRPDAVDPMGLRPDIDIYMGVRGAVSPDGIHWTFLPDPLVMCHADTHVVAYYDTVRRKYVMYLRDHMLGPQWDAEQKPHPPWKHWRRAISRTESEHFDRFPLGELVLAPDPAETPNCQLYTNCRTSIPGAPDHHLMFPTVWDTGDDTTFVVAASSYDGKLWQYMPGGRLFRTADPGQWDGGCLFAYPDLLELPNGDYALPYTGYDVPHKYPRGAAAKNMGYLLWPKGRFAGIEAEEVGQFTISSVVVPGNVVRINALTKRAGAILVEACDAQGRPFPGYRFDDCIPLVGDCHRTRVTWRHNDRLPLKENEAVVLRFSMRRATIFHLEFADR